MSLRDEILATRNAADVPIRPVPTPEWPALDGKLFVKTLSAFEGDAHFNTQDDDDDEGNERAKFACRVLCDENRNRVLQNDDAILLGHKELPVVERIYWIGRLHNGLTEENRRAVRKNSPSTAENGLPCSSVEPSTPASDSTSSGS